MKIKIIILSQLIYFIYRGRQILIPYEDKDNDYGNNNIDNSKYK